MIGYSAVILAGGKSSRMGRNKAELEIGGVTFTEFLADKLWNMGIDDIMISGYERMVKNTRNVKDVYPGQGPLSGIHSCLCSSLNRKVFVLAGDAPLIPVHFLIELSKAHKSAITVASYNERLQPLAGLYNKEVGEVAEKLICKGKLNVSALIESVSFDVLPFYDNELLLRGCNTPEEYKEMLKLTGIG